MRKYPINILSSEQEVSVAYPWGKNLAEAGLGLDAELIMMLRSEVRQNDLGNFSEEKNWETTTEFSAVYK